MDNVSKSLFALCKTNNGLFKSENQAKYLQSVAGGNSWFCSKSYSLGSDYNFKRCGSADFLFELDQAGVVKVTKTTGRGKKSVFFKRVSQAEFEAVQAEKLQKELRWRMIDEKRTKIESRINQVEPLTIPFNLIKGKDLSVLGKDEIEIFMIKCDRVIEVAEKRIKTLNSKLSLLINSY